jgi:hypothetical protein
VGLNDERAAGNGEDIAMSTCRYILPKHYLCVLPALDRASYSIRPTAMAHFPDCAKVKNAAGPPDRGAGAKRVGRKSIGARAGGFTACAGPVRFTAPQEGRLRISAERAGSAGKSLGKLPSSASDRAFSLVSNPSTGALRRIGIDVPSGDF